MKCENAILYSALLKDFFSPSVVIAGAFSSFSANVSSVSDNKGMSADSKDDLVDDEVRDVGELGV
jgi:hypothetical protein